MALGADGASSSNSSNSTAGWKYHVFLSFRGEDTRTNFTDHLYAALERKGIITFRDDEELERGQVIKPSLLQAIEESFSAVVVLSPHYASSTWCLDELEKILRSRIQVFPIFYGVDPSDVRHQRGSFEEAFRKHDEKFTEDSEKVQKWRDALEEVANLSGWDSKNWHEARLIEEVTKAVWSKLYPKLLPDLEILVGIDSKIKEMDSLIMKGLNDVRIIGIWGMGGIGKTTLARVVFEKIHGDFDISYFLSNIREVFEKDGLIHLQRKLLSHVNYKRSMEIDDCYEGRKLIKSMLHNKKVLIVLDDVSDISQLENLAEKQEWFGSGSRVIITTRDARLLTLRGVSAKFDVNILSKDESFQLFCQKAFKGGQPTEHYLELSRRVVKYAEGLPLALKVLGSFFYGRTECEWKDGLDKFSKIPSIDIMKILKVSYDGLDDAEKNIFLDIACFFKGMPKDWGIRILKSCGFNPTIEIKHLIEKSMLVDDGIVLEMHDLLQEMGKSIVLQESPNDASKRSRLWTLEDINYVLKKNKGSEVIQCMVLNLSQPYKAYWDPDAFSNMWNLRLLIISNLNLPCGIKSFPPALKVLQWVGYTQDALPQGVQLDELVDFDMQHSKTKQLWKETQFLEKLKFVNLSHCIDLIKTPNFVGIPNLERLVLERCKSLIEVHHSLGQLKKLILINLKGCISLKTLPGKLETDCLETFILSGCSKVRKLPEFGKNMKCLSTLNLEETAIVKLPESLAYLTSLAILNLKNCKNLVCLPGVLQNLKYIKSINIFGCSKFERFPDNWNENKTLEELDVSQTAIRKVPSLIGLSLLWKLNLSHCNINDGSLLKDISRLSSLFYLDLSRNNFVNLPAGFISNLLRLKCINISYCPKLQSLPELPPNVGKIDASSCASMEPLLGIQRLWDLFTSLDMKPSQSNSVYITLDVPGKEIPSWFHNQMVEDIVFFGSVSCVSFIANIPDYCLSSKWWGIAVCFFLQADKVPCLDEELFWSILWRCRDSKDHSMNGYSKEYGIHEQYNSIDQLHIFYIPGCSFSTKRLELEFVLGEWGHFTVLQKMGVNWEIKRCGWRVLCKEDIEAQRRGEGYSNSQKEKENCNKCCELEDLTIYHCPRLQPLPKLPPNVRTIYLSDCASMEPLLGTQLLWDLIASIDLESLDFYPFKLTLIGKKVPSWFQNQNYSFGREMGPSVSMSSAVSVIADIPHYCCSSYLCPRIVVCLDLQANIVSATSFGEPWIKWKYYIYGDNKTWEEISLWGRRPIHEQYNSAYQLHIFYISVNFIHGKKLKLDFFIEMEQKPGVHKQKMPVNWGIKRCRWRVLCEDDIETWRQTRSEGYGSNIEFASQHLDGFNEVRITEDGVNSYAKRNQQDKGNCNKCFEVSLASILSWCPFLSCFLCNRQA